MIERTCEKAKYAEVPPKVEYSLTDDGETYDHDIVIRLAEPHLKARLVRKTPPRRSQGK